MYAKNKDESLIWYSLQNLAPSSPFLCLTNICNQSYTKSLKLIELGKEKNTGGFFHNAVNRESCEFHSLQWPRTEEATNSIAHNDRERRKLRVPQPTMTENRGSCEFHSSQWPRIEEAASSTAHNDRERRKLRVPQLTMTENRGSCEFHSLQWPKTEEAESSTAHNDREQRKLRAPRPQWPTTEGDASSTPTMTDNRGSCEFHAQNDQQQKKMRIISGEEMRNKYSEESMSFKFKSRVRCSINKNHSYKNGSFHSPKSYLRPYKCIKD